MVDNELTSTPPPQKEKTAENLLNGRMDPIVSKSIQPNGLWNVDKCPTWRDVLGSLKHIGTI